MHVICNMPSMGVQIQTFTDNMEFSSHAGFSDSPIDIVAPSSPGTLLVKVGCHSSLNAPAIMSFSVTEGIRFLRPGPNERLTYARSSYCTQSIHHWGNRARTHSLL
jgi:hypothetical protein